MSRKTAHKGLFVQRIKRTAFSFISQKPGPFLGESFCVVFSFDYICNAVPHRQVSGEMLTNLKSREGTDPSRNIYPFRIVIKSNSNEKNHDHCTFRL